jgi:hypothetical protein
MVSITSELSQANPSFRQFVAYKLGKAIDRSATKERRVRTFVEASIRILLHIVGFSSLTFAGFYWHVIAGLVMIAISCFVMAELLTSTNPPSTPDRPNPMR